MGYEVDRFVNRVDDEYLCSICLCVFENPVHGPCGHTFCLKCIENWIPMNVNACPLDKKQLYKKDLVPVSIPFRNLLNRLDIKCDFEPAGCTNVCQMHHLPAHVKVCPFNPDGEMVCQQGCDLTFLRRDQDSHKCIEALKELVSKQRGQLADLNKQISAKRSYDSAFFQRFADRSERLTDYMTVHEDQRMEMLSRTRQMIRRPRVNFDSSSGSRARTPPPPNISLSSRLHQLPISVSAATSAHAHLTRSRLPLETSEVQVQLQRLTDDDLEAYGVSRPMSSSRILSSQLVQSRNDRSSPQDMQPVQQQPSSSTSSSSSSSASSSSSSQALTQDNRFNLLTRMLSNAPGCSSTRND